MLPGFPQVIVITEITASVPYQNAAPEAGIAMVSRSLNRATKPIAFDAVASTPATIEEEPEYASGIARWNGAAPTLNPNATSIIPTPAAATGSRDSMDCHDWDSPVTLRSPFHR